VPGQIYEASDLFDQLAVNRGLLFCLRCGVSALIWRYPYRVEQGFDPMRSENKADDLVGKATSLEAGAATEFRRLLTGLNIPLTGRSQ